MLNIYLVRHGQDADNEKGILNGHRDEPLTALGLTQAERLAEFVKERNLSFDKVYSSPLQRAYVTATKITEALDLPSPEVLLELIERDFGVLTGEKVSDITRLCAPDILETDTVTYFLEVEGAETYPQLIVRAQNLLKFVSDNYSEANILLVGHGDFGKMIYAAYYNLPWDEALKNFHFGNSELVLLSPNEDFSKAQIFKTTQFNS